MGLLLNGLSFLVSVTIKVNSFKGFVIVGDCHSRVVSLCRVCHFKGLSLLGVCTSRGFALLGVCTSSDLYFYGFVSSRVVCIF